MRQMLTIVAGGIIPAAMRIYRIRSFFAAQYQMMVCLVKQAAASLPFKIIDDV